MKNNLLKKFLSFSIGGYINILIGLFTVPITTRMLSPEQYGISSLVNTITNLLFVLCCLGLEQGFVRFFYDEEEENRGRLLYNCLYYPFFLTIFVSGALILLKEQVSIFIIGKYDINIIWILILNIIFISLNNFSLLIIRMQQKGKLYSIFNVLIKVLEFVFILLLYKIYGNNYRTLVLSVLFSTIIVTVLSVYTERKFWKFKGKAKTTTADLLKFSSPLVLTMALGWVFSSCDKIVIKIFSNLEEVGLYAGAFKIIALISVIQNGFTTFWTPVIYEHYSKNPNDLIFFKKANDYLSLLFFILGIGVLLSRDILILLLGKKYYSSAFIMPMLIFIPIMYLISETTMMGISFKKQTKCFLYISIAVSITNLVGNIILVPYLGAKGAAISTGVSYILYFYLRTYFSTKLMNFGFNLKRIYFCISLMGIYALILSFYNNIYFTIIVGIILEFVLLMIYFPVLKEIYFKYKKGEII